MKDFGPIAVAVVVLLTGLVLTALVVVGDDDLRGLLIFLPIEAVLVWALVRVSRD